MKLLFDHNLSSRLVSRLADRYPNASHVVFVGLERASDLTVWNYAQTNDYIIVTKDSDFNDVSVLRGFPPKVIWLHLGNCITDDVERVLRDSYEMIEAFASDPTLGVLELF
jgi:predicted nuclease of predicted toxin-antitoxin system